MTADLDRKRLTDLLAALGARLAAAGIAGRLYVVGGAAMALEWDARRSTHDVDALLEPATTLKEIAAQMAAEEGLSPTWLNDAVRPFLPSEDTDGGRLLGRFGGLDVVVAPPEHLLAMKMASFRDSDLHDLQVLVAALGLDDPEAIADVCEALYGEDGVVLPPRPDLLWQAGVVLAAGSAG